MGILARGVTYGATETITAAKLHSLVDDGSISGILTADISDAQITNALINDVSGAKLTTLTAVPAGAGVIPAANLTSVAQKGANSDITSLTGLTTLLSRAQGGLASSVANNAASGVVFLDASSKLPAVDGSALTNIPSPILSSGCLVYLSASQDGLVDDTANVVGFNAEVFDSANEFNTSTSTFTAGTTGKYLIVYNLTIHDTVDTKTYNFPVYVNTTEYHNFYIASGTGNQSISFNRVFSLTAGDTVLLRATPTTTGASNTDINGGIQYSTLSIIRL